jgi:hypothetical protein
VAVAALVLALSAAPGPAIAGPGDNARPPGTLSAAVDSDSGRILASEKPADADDEQEGSGPVTGLLALGGVALLSLVGAVVWSIRRRPPAS